LKASGDIEQTMQPRSTALAKIEQIEMPKSDNFANMYEEEESSRDPSKELGSPTLNTYENVQE